MARAYQNMKNNEQKMNHGFLHLMAAGPGGFALSSGSYPYCLIHVGGELRAPFLSVGHNCSALVFVLVQLALLVQHSNRKLILFVLIFSASEFCC